MFTDTRSIHVLTKLNNPILYKKYASSIPKSNISLFCTQNELSNSFIPTNHVQISVSSPLKTLVVIGLNQTRIRASLNQLTCIVQVDKPVDNFGQGG